MSIIKVNNVSKEFTYYKKAEGLKNSLRNLISRKNLTKVAVDSLSFNIKKGEIVGFLGPNGAGKTTTLKMLSGILCPSAGSIEVGGFVPFERKVDFKKTFTIVMGQKSQLWWDLPAVESLKLNQYIYGIDDSEYNRTVGELVELLDVKELMNVQVRRLSLGERMKFELINSLVHSPEIIFLDEPTIGLDIISQKAVRDFLKRYNALTKTTILLTSHYMQDIEALCSRALVINKGKLIYDGQLSEISDMSSKKNIIMKMDSSMESSLQVQELVRFGEITEIKDNVIVISVSKDKINDTVKCIMDQFTVYDINIEDIPLEESLEYLFRGV
jgi:ABC-2 type transport system ATP-binding protein